MLCVIPRYLNNNWDNNQSPSSSEGSDYSSSPSKSCLFSQYCPPDSLMPRSDYADCTVLDNTKPAVPAQCAANSYCNANVDTCDFDPLFYDNLLDIMSCISSDFTSVKPLGRTESSKLGMEIKQEPDATLTYCDLSRSQASCSRTLSRESDSFGKSLPQKSMSTVVSPSFPSATSCSRVPPTCHTRASACIKQEPTGGDTSALDISCLVGDAVGPIIKEALLDDVVKTSSELGIGPDPYQWSIADVHTWLCYTSKIFEIPMANLNVQISGGTLCELTEEQLRELWPMQADIIYGYLDLWKKRGKVAAFIGHQQSQPRQQQDHQHHQHQQQHQYQQQQQQRLLPCQEQTHLPNPQLLAESSSSSQPYPLPPERGFIGMSPLMHWGRSTPSPSQRSDLSGTSDEDTKCHRNSQSNIHLWQFLKELLNNPRSYGSFIRWLDRPKGIFKIEDSVTVAKLWGKRKNRPAMNYDKLSRSLRQYYKKGIMKKTERSQRLVYQFCQPYRM